MILNLRKDMIWAEIDMLDKVLAIAKIHGFSETHPFVLDIIKFKSMFEKDLIEATEGKE